MFDWNLALKALSKKKQSSILSCEPKLGLVLSWRSSGIRRSIIVSFIIHHQCSELVQWGPSESSELRASPEFFPRSLGTQPFAAWATRGSLGTRAQQEEATRSSLGTRSSLSRCELALSTVYRDIKPVSLFSRL